MVSTTFLFGVLAFSATTTLALPRPQPAALEAGCDDGTITPEDIIQIAPATATCDKTAPFADECADAERAAQALNNAFERYNITSPGAQAALIALMLYESLNFKYNHNHFPEPGRAGQGTRNMQMYEFNEKYAIDVVGEAAVKTAKAPGGDTAEDAVLKLVQGDTESFGSAAWFLTTQCPAGIKDGLADGSTDGWNAYLKCVGAAHSADRDPAWEKAKEVLGVGA